MKNDTNLKIHDKKCTLPMLSNKTYFQEPNLASCNTRNEYKREKTHDKWCNV